jgi:hypothetical protein
MYQEMSFTPFLTFLRITTLLFIKQASLAADSCERWGIPLMIEAMAGDENV